MTLRLYINGPLHAGLPAPLSAEQSHYLKNVLRREEGDEVRLFNGKDGEFAATIAELKKKSGAAQVTQRTRDQTAEPDLTLYFAPVKRGALETIVQKAVEAGAARLQPVLTERTVAPKLNIERLQAIATEAAEQCGRMSVPSVGEPIKLAAMLARWPQDARLMYCDEAGDNENEEWGGSAGRAAPALDALTAVNSKTDRRLAPWGVLTGPEGGFSPGERAQVRSHAFVVPVTLGPRILRADTAAVAALVLWQAALGDWRGS